MKVYLMQHGKPVPKEEDPDKPLSEEGKRDVMEMARFLQTFAAVPEVCFHSGKTRAEQTAAIIASHLGSGLEVRQRGGLSPLDDVRKVGEALEQGSRDTIVVGHLPHLARLAALLLTGEEKESLVTFQQGGILCLKKSDTGDWSIGWMVVPEMVQGLTGVADPHAA
jgi:phosphohistidine phosphatase